MTRRWPFGTAGFTLYTGDRSMTLTNTAAALFATMVLLGCTDGGTQQSSLETVSKVSYQCDDGSVVEATYPSTDTAEVIIEGKSVEMTSAVSASGARYVGGGWEWWTKGTTEALLAPLAEGEDIASAKRVNCTAP